MNIILLAACVFFACFGIFTALLGSAKPKLFGAVFGVIIGCGLSMTVAKFMGLAITSIPVAAAMGISSLILLILCVWKETFSLFLISLFSGIYIGGGVVYILYTTMNLSFGFMICGLAIGILALIFAAICLTRPNTSILVSTSLSGGAMVSISVSIILSMVLSVTTTSGLIGYLYTFYKSLSFHSIVMIWVFGLLLGFGAMILQRLLLKSVDNIDDEDSWEDWQIEASGQDDEIEAPVVKRGPRRKKKKDTGTFDWNDDSDEYPEEQEQNNSELLEDINSTQSASSPYEDKEIDWKEPPFKEEVQSIPPHRVSAARTLSELESTKVFRKVVLPKNEATQPVPKVPEEKETAEPIVTPSSLSHPTFAPRSQNRK